MRKLLFTLGLLFVLSTIFCQTNPNHVRVKGYFRKDGTYVQSHYRTAPNYTNRDNFTTRPNVNPYTGKPGYIEPDNKTLYPSYYSNKNSTSKGKVYVSSSNYHNSTLFSDLDNLAQSYDANKNIVDIYHTKDKNISDNRIEGIKPSKAYINYYESQPIVELKAPVNLRELPFYSAKIVGGLKKGDEVHLLETFEEWCKIYKNGEIGYIPLKSFSLDLTSATSKKKDLSPEYILTKETSLRERADSQSKVLLRFKVGDKIKILEKTNKYWWYGEFNGKKGWVKCALLKEKIR